MSGEEEECQLKLMLLRHRPIIIEALRLNIRMINGKGYEEKYDALQNALTDMDTLN